MVWFSLRPLDVLRVFLPFFKNWANILGIVTFDSVSVTIEPHRFVLTVCYHELFDYFKKSHLLSPHESCTSQVSVITLNFLFLFIMYYYYLPLDDNFFQHLISFLFSILQHYGAVKFVKSDWYCLKTRIKAKKEGLKKRKIRYKMCLIYKLRLNIRIFFEKHCFFFYYQQNMQCQQLFSIIITQYQQNPWICRFFLGFIILSQIYFSHYFSISFKSFFGIRMLIGSFEKKNNLRTSLSYNLYFFIILIYL